jgi:hypothetical protein
VVVLLTSLISLFVRQVPLLLLVWEQKEEEGIKEEETREGKVGERCPVFVQDGPLAGKPELSKVE